MITKVGENMAEGYIDSVEKVSEFLSKMKSVLCSKDFDLDKDFDVLLGSEEGTTGYKNAATMVELEFDKKDVCDVLVSLTEKDYCETVPDRKDPSLPPLYVFGNLINTKEMYIKVKIRDRASKQVFCLSFHFAEFPIKHPYSKIEGA